MTDKNTPVILWFRQDLRLADNPALTEAIALNRPIIPLFILDKKVAGPWFYGGAAQWWLHHALKDLTDSLRSIGLSLVLRSGDAQQILENLYQETGATHVVWNRRYEPYAIAQDKQIKEALKAKGVQVESYNGRLLIEPWVIQTGAGEPYRVFTPFWKASLAYFKTHPIEAPLPTPKKAMAYTTTITSEALSSWELLPTKPDWSAGLQATWTVSEQAAITCLTKFVDEALISYKTDRDFPAKPSTSRLSPYLAFGQLSPRTCWQVARTAIDSERIPVSAHKEAEHFITELGWREFAYHLLFHFPNTAHEPLYSKYKAFPWRNDPEALRRWQKGQTGYPLVDAGMRQLWQTGWLHNRLRMVVGSFLVKHLILPWQEGAAWFWDTLVDADLASNSLGWQWTAGCGADAAPYFRIFNPIIQSKKFDTDGVYIRDFVPELRGLGRDQIHAPWELGVTPSAYPQPLIEHSLARDRALLALAKLKESG